MSLVPIAKWFLSFSERQHASMGAKVDKLGRDMTVRTLIVLLLRAAFLRGCWKVYWRIRYWHLKLVIRPGKLTTGKENTE